MTNRPIRQARSASRRQAIIQAALSCFTELGYERATLEDIRRRSGASTGSIYHHFTSKEQLAADVYLAGILDYQAGVVDALRKHSGARDGVFAMVRYHLKWVERHPDWAKYLSQMRRNEFLADAEETIHQRNREFLRQVSDWFKPHIKAKRVRRLPPDVYVAVLLGPCQEFARIWLAGRARTDLEAAARALGETTWQAVRRPPSPK